MSGKFAEGSNLMWIIGFMLRLNGRIQFLGKAIWLWTSAVNFFYSRLQIIYQTPPVSLFNCSDGSRSFKVKYISEYSWFFNYIIGTFKKRELLMFHPKFSLKKLAMSSVRLKVVLWSCECCVNCDRIVVELFVAAL